MGLMGRVIVGAAVAVLPVACSSGTAAVVDAGDAALAFDAAGGDGSARTATFSPVAIGAGAGDLVNPLRGQYRWLGLAPYPAGAVDNDSYQRWNWIDFEPTHLAYAWKLIDDEIAAAKGRHGRFGMRIMPVCQGCSNHTYQGGLSAIPDDLAAAVNPLIVAAPGEATRYVLPDWNSEAYLARVEELVNAIGARYKDEPTFAWFDVSAYGNWGEFHVWPWSQSGGPYDTSTQRPITDANARRIVQMNAAAFPGKLLVLNSENRAATAEAVATTTPPIGFRVDCLGADGLGGGQDPIDSVAGALEHWRKAPFITEWCQYNIGGSSANLFVQGDQQVKAYHVSMLSSGNFTQPPTTAAEIAAFTDANRVAGYRLRASSVTVAAHPGGDLDVSITWVNDGVAPTYLRWRVVVVLQGGTTRELPMAFDLRQVADAPVIASETLHSALPAGTYTASLRVDDVQAISPPMFLAMQGRDAAGNYLLGDVALP